MLSLATVPPGPIPCGPTEAGTVVYGAFSAPRTVVAATTEREPRSTEPEALGMKAADLMRSTTGVLARPLPKSSNRTVTWPPATRPSAVPWLMATRGAASCSKGAPPTKCGVPSLTGAEKLDPWLVEVRTSTVLGFQFPW